MIDSYDLLLASHRLNEEKGTTGQHSCATRTRRSGEHRLLGNDSTLQGANGNDPRTASGP